MRAFAGMRRLVKRGLRPARAGFVGLCRAGLDACAALGRSIHHRGFGAAVIVVLSMLSIRGLPAGEEGKVPSSPAGPERVAAPPPPFSEGIFPCSDCHAGMPPNRTRRTLTEMHTDIELKHDEAHRWCLDCHDAANRDFLHLASGERVPFSESYRVCGQCHGEKYRDWRAGVHGRRTGNWNGDKTYLLCAHCHNPHQPRFRALAPKPAPLAPNRQAPR